MLSFRSGDSAPWLCDLGSTVSYSVVGGQWTQNAGSGSLYNTKLTRVGSALVLYIQHLLTNQ